MELAGSLRDAVSATGGAVSGQVLRGCFVHDFSQAVEVRDRFLTARQGSAKEMAQNSSLKPYLPPSPLRSHFAPPPPPSHHHPTPTLPQSKDVHTTVNLLLVYRDVIEKNVSRLATILHDNTLDFFNHAPQLCSKENGLER